MHAESGYAILPRVKMSGELDAGGQAGTVTVLITTTLPAGVLDAFRNLNHRLRLIQLSPEEQAFYASRQPVHDDHPSPLQRSLAAHLAAAEVLITFPQAPADLSWSVPRLRWLQLLTAGADELPDLELLKRVPVTTVRGARARAVAEYALLFMLAFAKRLPDSIALMHRREWQRVDVFELAGRTAGIVGLGSIGAEVARLAHDLGMRVIATRRSADAPGADLVDQILPPERLSELLRQSDFVILTAPSTPDTHHLIGAAELRLMRPTATLINLARGALIDEAALVAALRTGQIAGAGLDVFEAEPLPPSNPLYDMENVLITCHNAGMTDRFVERALPLLTENLRRFLAGEQLHNQLDPERGY